jgi:hypothetical protein
MRLSPSTASDRLIYRTWRSNSSSIDRRPSITFVRQPMSNRFTPALNFLEILTNAEKTEFHTKPAICRLRRLPVRESNGIYRLQISHLTSGYLEQNTCLVQETHTFGGVVQIFHEPAGVLRSGILEFVVFGLVFEFCRESVEYLGLILRIPSSLIRNFLSSR